MDGLLGMVVQEGFLGVLERKEGGSSFDCVNERFDGPWLLVRPYTKN